MVTSALEVSESVELKVCGADRITRVQRAELSRAADGKVTFSAALAAVVPPIETAPEPVATLRYYSRFNVPHYCREPCAGVSVAGCTIECQDTSPVLVSAPLEPRR